MPTGHPDPNDGVEPSVTTDRPCRRCGYNVRGVPVTHACPECGTAVLHTLFARHWGPTHTQAHGENRRAAAYVATRLGYPSDAVLFVLDTYIHMLEQARMDPAAADLRNVNVLLFCRIFIQYAICRHGTPERVRELLADWRLTASADLGRILSITCPTAAADVTGRFNGACTLDQMFT